MVPRVKNAHYGRVALVSYDVNLVFDKTQQRNVQWVTRVVWLFNLLLHPKCQKATLIPKEAMILMIQSTITSQREPEVQKSVQSGCYGVTS